MLSPKPMSRLVVAGLVALLAVAPALASSGVVVAADPLAAAVGADVLARGGNAVDAAVATAFALAVTYPQAGNLGGGGFFLAHPADGPPWVLDFRERAPAGATPEMFLGPDGRPDPGRSRTGPLSVGVPGSVAGLLMAHRRFGALPREDVIGPAIRLAEDGFPVPPGLAAKLEKEHDKLSADPYTASVFTRDGRPLRAGERLVQSDLAVTLRAILRDGERAFYRGPVARRLADRLERDGGVLRQADLKAYRPVEREPLRGRFAGLDVITMPPPSAGGLAVLQMLQIVSGLELEAPGTAATLHRLASSMKLAFADRARYVGDPDFVEVPVARLISAGYAEELRRRIPADRALPSRSLAGGTPVARGSGETTHISVIDAGGGAVSLTTTLNSNFGSGIAVPGHGFLLNNEMDDFATAPGLPNLYGLIEGTANAVAPGKRMASSMCPTILASDGRPRLVLGSPGGSYIPTAVVQVILNVTVFGMDLSDAVTAPRAHHQWLPDVLELEDGVAAPGARERLEAMGYVLAPPRRSPGSVMAAARDPHTGELSGAADPRRYGAAVLAESVPAAVAP